ncbi:hypothetical protein ABPG72_014451 [Tetrahymena utriculariae]
MGNQLAGEKTAQVKINMEISNQFNQILKCPSQTDLNNKLNVLLNTSYQHAEWIGSILPEDIRQYYHEHCENIENILQFIIDFLYDTIQEKKELDKNYIMVINNCLRLLTIIVPVAYENMEKATTFFWDYQGMNYQMKNVQMQHHNKLVVYISNDEEIDKKRESHVSSGIKLIQSLQTLCFYHSYTLPLKTESASVSSDSGLGTHIDNQLLWNNIISTAISHPNNNSKYDENRFMVLSAILSCISSTLFVPFYGQNYLNPWLAYLTSPINRQNGLFFINVLYQVLCFKPPLIESQAAKLNKAIVLICSQITYAILCHQPKNESLNTILEVNVGLQQVNDYFQDQVDECQRGKLDVVAVLQNGILNYLNSFNETNGVKPGIADFIAEKIFYLLEEPLRTENSLFVNSLIEINFSEESYGILQQILYFCPQLFENICSSEHKLYRLFKVSIHQFCKSLDEVKVNNTYYVSLCLLTILSSNQAFCRMLNRKKDFNMNLKNFPIIDGTLADLLISCLAQTMINNKFTGVLCHHYNLMCILKNISPFVKNISRVSCQKLNQLAILFTDMDFLAQTQYTPFCIVKLIQLYNYILSYNMSENYALVYEIFNRQEVFSRIPRINFRENILRAYFRQLKERQDCMKNNTTVPNTNPIPSPQNQQQAQLNRQGQQLQALNQQIQLQKKESQQKNQQDSKKEIKSDKIQEDIPSSSSLASKKRPKRVIKKKVGLENHEAEQKGLNSKKNLDEHEQSQPPSKQDLDEEEEEKEETKTDLPNIQNKNQANQNRGFEIVIEQKNPEDLFVEKWKNFNWKMVYSTIPLQNISLVLKNVNEFVNTKLKKSRFELTYEQFISEKNFLNSLNDLMVKNQQFEIDQFQNYEDILGLSYQCCWAQVAHKSKFFPHFNSTKILFFRTDISPIQVNINDQSINVELQSNNTLTEIK